MSENSYNTAGWLAVVQAILFPAGFVVAIIQGAIAVKYFDRPPETVFGPADIMFLIGSILSIYVFWQFKRLLNERHNIHDIDNLIIASILWLIAFEGIGLVISFFTVSTGSDGGLPLKIALVAFFAVSMIAAGIIDIMIAVRLLRIKEQLTDLISVFAYVCMVSGIMEVSVLLAPLSILMVPVTMIVLALIFFKKPEQVEFV